ncbi:asparaginase [Fructobacillus ficulneus]|uniref:asparaginase n=1 Tax=Fructobacillus ficulneus TaxID=157463 RepID=A0A0K8MIV5_9LACO|nr:asparaginase [Fructobacillus ficulneus]GAP00398.1 L-asparaginase/ Glu-tRNAGln amidotransferase subunit D [Fructobacillus ficulneus]
MKKILVLHTGGTIAMHEDVDGDVEQGAQNPLNDVQFDLPAVELVTEDIFNLPSEHITPDNMLALYNRLKNAEDEFDGVVITHGTDTLEETSFFLDSTLDLTIPIVMTGAMRSSNEIGSDGLYNFQSALRVAIDDQAAKRGVLVVLNDEIHAARFVTKTHATNVATFASPISGAMGMVNKRKILFFYDLPNKKTYPISAVDKRIPVMKAYAGMDGHILTLLAEAGIDGIVIEALGAGNLGTDAARGVLELLAADIPVVIVSRSFKGIAEPVYDYLGGGVQLEKAGAIFATAVNGQKARLKLLIGLENKLNTNKLNEFLHEF